MKKARESDVVELVNALADWRSELGGQVEAGKKEFIWNQRGCPENYTLSVRSFVNLGRIVREAVQNSLRHGCDQVMRIDIEISREKDDHQLHIRVTDDKPLPLNREWKTGIGIVNMKNRAREIGAELDWQFGAHDQPGTCVELKYSLARESESL